MRPVGRFLNSTTGLLLSLVTLTLLGAFVFTRIEAPAEVQTRVQATKARQRIFVLAQELAEEGEKADWSKLVVQVNKYRDKLKQAWKAGNDELGNAVVPPSWSLWGSIYYCITLITTIGYGNVCPHTTIGRVLTIGYCLLAIPLCTLVFSRISKIIVRFLKAINLMTLESSGIPVGLRDAYSRADTTFDFSFLTCMALLVGYFSLSGVIYCWGIGPTADEWSPFDAVYFSFISMTSIGLGDIVPTSDIGLLARICPHDSTLRTHCAFGIYATLRRQMCIGDQNLPPKLFAGNSAFALATIKERMPVILVRTLDDLSRNLTKYGSPEKDFEDAKLVIHRLSKLRYELVTDKPFAALFGELTSTDIDQWNAEISHLQEGQNSAFSASWLFTECYMYRRIMNIVSQSLPSFDPFAERKLEAFQNSCRLIVSMIACLNRTLTSADQEQPADHLKFFLACSLWSNEFDLSLSAGDTQVENPHSSVNHLREEVLSKLRSSMAVDELDTIARSWPSQQPATVAVVMDNAGPEMVADLVLAEYLLSSHLAERVVFYPKSLPWFVSDVTPKDLDWLLGEGLPSMVSISEIEPEVRESISSWAKKWRLRFDSGSFSTIVHPFWTLPLGYNYLQSTAPDLFRSLTKESSVTIFKGDLHYRKLLEDRSWAANSEDTKFVFGRCFPPAADASRDSCALILALRVAKSDVAVGVSEDRLSELCTEDPDWWTKGRYGFAQIISTA